MFEINVLRGHCKEEISVFKIIVNSITNKIFVNVSIFMFWFFDFVTAKKAFSLDVATWRKIIFQRINVLRIIRVEVLCFKTNQTNRSFPDFCSRNYISFKLSTIFHRFSLFQSCSSHLNPVEQYNFHVAELFLHKFINALIYIIFLQYL